MHIGIIGGGSLGLLISSYLSKKHHVTLYVKRREQKVSIEENQLHLYKESVHFFTTSIKVREMSELKREDCFIICVKQTSIEDVVQELLRLKSNSKYIFLQNGMGHIKSMKKLTNPLFVGVVEHGAHRINDYQVDHLGEGVIKIASITSNKEQLTSITTQLHDDDFPFQQSDDWELLLKNKLIVNAVINPITALFDIPNGSILSNKHYLYLATRICKEVASVLHLNEAESWRNIQLIAHNTRNNSSSMRVDIQHNRMTEVDAILGYVIEVAQNPVPYSTFIYQAILGIQKERNTFK